MIRILSNYPVDIYSYFTSPEAQYLHRHYILSMQRSQTGVQLLVTQLWQGNAFTSVCHSVHREGVWQADTPPPDGQCSRRYASYWNAFLLSIYKFFFGPSQQYIIFHRKVRLCCMLWCEAHDLSTSQRLWSILMFNQIHKLSC